MSSLQSKAAFICLLPFNSARSVPDSGRLSQVGKTSFVQLGRSRVKRAFFDSSASKVKKSFTISMVNVAPASDSGAVAAHESSTASSSNPVGPAAKDQLARTLVRQNIITMQPYVPILPFEVLSKQLGRAPEEIVKLDANENPYGPSPKVLEALAQAPFLNIYPDPESRELRESLSAFTGMPPEYLLAGNGADELIDLMFRAFVDPGEAVVNCPPTFGMYKFDGDVTGAQILNVWRKDDFAIDVDAIEALFTSGSPTPKLVFVTAPNNPDGCPLSDSDLDRLLALPAIVVLDEAYVEFQRAPGATGGGESIPSRVKMVLDHPNLVVLRTFSKFAGLAGMRVGYGAFPLGVIEHLWKIKQPYNVTVASQIAAMASLRDLDHLFANLNRMIEQRDRLYSELLRFGWLKVHQSQANFVLCRVLPNDRGLTALKVKQALLEKGIMIRYYNSPGITDCVRFSVGTAEQIDLLLAALKEF